MEEKFWEEDALQGSYIEEFIIQVGDSDEQDSNSDSDISGSSEESDDETFMLSGGVLTAAVSGGVGIPSPT